jgi:hypothetical protein
MTVTFRLACFGWNMVALTIRLDVDQVTAAAVQPGVGGAVKRISRRWADRMMS